MRSKPAFTIEPIIGVGALNHPTPTGGFEVHVPDETWRKMFAGLAMPSVITVLGSMSRGDEALRSESLDQEIKEHSYRIADAMLAELKETEKKQ